MNQDIHASGGIILDYKEDRFVTCSKCGNRIWYDSHYSYFPDSINGFIDYCGKCAPEPPTFGQSPIDYEHDGLLNQKPPSIHQCRCVIKPQTRLP